jgi:hypothetical protein
MQNAKYKYLNKRFTNKSGESGYVIKYVNSKEVYLKFDLTAWIGCFQIDNLKRGEFKDKMSPSAYGVGFVGDGEYKPSKNGKRTKVYDTWTNMLQRCYDLKCQQKHPTYKGCSVDKEWHNFQNFAQWVEENYPQDGQNYQLDKDHLVKGNKIYSADTCCFLTHQQNNEVAHAKHYKFISPNGEKVEVYNLSKFCIANNLHAAHMYHVANGNRSHHKGWTKA